MNRSQLSKLVHSETELLLRQQVIDQGVFDKIRAVYPTTKWDWHSLGHWFLFFGAVSTIAGAATLFHQYWGFTLQNLALLLGLLLVGLAVGSFKLKRQNYALSARALELLAACDIIGLTFVIGMIYSTGSGNWPALLLIDFCIILPLAYALHNVLILILSAFVFFTWFGGVTGYVSGWGAYYFGMNYPLRFLCASLFILGVSIIHLVSETGPLASYRGFFKVWLSTGLFFAEMSLWLLSIFGNYGSMESGWHDASRSELIMYNSSWAIANAALIFVGSARLMKMVVGYGATFLIIQLYTLYFSYLAPNIDPMLATTLAGLLALGLVWFLEGKRRSLKADKSTMVAKLQKD
jgi:hypothetical protein